MPLLPSSLVSPLTVGLLTPSDPLTAALSDASLGVFEVDLQTNETRWSQPLFDMFGLDVHASADDIRARIHRDDIDSLNLPAAEFRVIRPDGSIRWLSVRSRVIGDRQMGFVTDETTRRQSDQRRDRFLALLAHDLRNPLAPLHTAAELMRRAEMQPARILTIAEMLTRQVKQMSNLIDELVDVSRANQGRIELKRQAVDVRLVVDQAVAAIEPFVARRRQRIETDVVDGAPNVDADPERLAQVLGLLLDHASRASTEDAVVRVTVRRDAAGVVLQVADEGAGIEADRLATVFDLYPTVDGDPSRRQTLGIGMALVKALVELHGGTVEATSEGAGQGSTFTMRLHAAG